MIELNVNEYVKVKLTDIGKKELKRQYDEFVASFPSYRSEFKLPKEDDDGFSTWQLHSLMNTFGHMMSVGFDIPFERTILIDK